MIFSSWLIENPHGLFDIVGGIYKGVLCPLFLFIIMVRGLGRFVYTKFVMQIWYSIQTTHVINPTRELFVDGIIIYWNVYMEKVMIKAMLDKYAFFLVPLINKGKTKKIEL